MNKPKRKYLGTAGHSIIGIYCKFHLNTVVSYHDIKICVSSIGMNSRDNGSSFDTVGDNRYFETNVFYLKDGKRDFDREIELDDHLVWEHDKVTPKTIDFVEDCHEEIVQWVENFIRDQREYQIFKLSLLQQFPELLEEKQ